MTLLHMQRTPNIDTMSANKDASGVRILDHSFSHAILEIFLVWSVLNDRNDERIEIGERFSGSTDTDTFDHLLVDIRTTRVFLGASQRRPTSYIAEDQV